MKFDPATVRDPLPLSAFENCVVPRPIAWLSSRSADGVENLAPFSQFQVLTFDPPTVMFSANRHPDGRRKDTVVNAEETGWFVYNLATWDLREAVNITAMTLPPGESEFDRVGVTRTYAELSPLPMVAESPVHFECRYLSTTHLPGGSQVGTADVVFGRVERIHIDDDALTDDGRLDVRRIRPIARLGFNEYTVVADSFEMRVPGGGVVDARGRLEQPG
ncbi:flavin reductase family protein [Nocardioides piscis]|uniref:Flavin reductase family protein n=1 Tax=Nocardioides piscis TaxID=2714938 RepID=A0A6G7YJ71_9ACTN|nr:flavin reductase family protein [Nocardioides piscis]QIK76777.1 flavin reductase family protein [Nocardioides piscis]